MTIQPSSAQSFGNVLLEIRANQGIFLDEMNGKPPVTATSGEWEFLVGHGTAYKVLGIKEVSITSEGSTITKSKVIQLEQTKTGGAMARKRIVKQDSTKANRLITPEARKAIAESKRGFDAEGLPILGFDPEGRPYDCGNPPPDFNWPPSDRLAMTDLDEFRLVRPNA